VGTAAAVVATIWWWDGFSGPFLWLIDLQVALTGRFYWEPPAVAVLLTGLLFAVVLVAGLLDPIVPRFRARTWGRLFVTALVLLSVAAAAQAWRLWTAPAGPTHRFPPVQIVDLDRLDTPRLPVGPVRLIGKADPRALVKLRREPRSYYIYQPLSGLHRPAEDLPVPVIVRCFSRYGFSCVPPTFEGLLYRGADDDRDTYRLRRAGVVTTPDYYLLSPGLPRSDTYVEPSGRDRSVATQIGLGLVFFWGVGIFSWIKSPPSASLANAPSPAQAATVEDAPLESKIYLLPLIAGGFVLFFLTAISIVAGLVRLIPW